MSKCNRCGTTLHGLLTGTLCQKCRSIERERDEDRERKEEREEQAASALSELLSESARSREQSSEDLAAAAVYIANAINNPGDYIHPSCRLRTLKRDASRCPICHEDIDRQFWIDIETRERDARQRAKEAAEKAAAEEAAKQAETESSNRWNGALFSIVIFFAFTLPLIERRCSEPQAQVPPDKLITSKSVGSFQIGMNLAQVRQLLPNMKLVISSDGDGANFVEVKDGESAVMLLYPISDQTLPINDRTKIEYVLACDKRYATKEGVHPGMLLHDVEGAYGKLTKIRMSEIESREEAEFAQMPIGISLRIGGENYSHAGIYTQGSRETAQFSPNSSVRCIAISG